MRLINIGITSQRFLVAAPLVIAALTLSACGSGKSSNPGEPGKASAGQLAVVASFYPLQFAPQIGGDNVAVSSLTKPGAEPHDVELSPRDVASVSQAKLVVHQKGLQGAVDKAVESVGDRGLEVAPAANLDLAFEPAEAVRGPASGENAAGSKDPHFKLAIAIATRTATPTSRN